MWKPTASRLLWSFVKQEIDGRLVAFTEGINAASLWEPTQLVSLVPLASPHLETFLEANRSVIPKHLGGDFIRCKCQNADDPHRPHRDGCSGWWWCRNAYLWMRKAIVLEQVINSPAQNGNPDAAEILVWLDADTYFTATLRAETVEQCFGKDAGVFYLQNRRQHPETGVVGYHMQRGGRLIIERLLDRYMSGRFRQDPRWDDCWQLMQVLRESRDVKSVDIATAVGARSQVLPHSPLGKYLVHEKGTHKRKGIL